MDENKKNHPVRTNGSQVEPTSNGTSKSPLAQREESVLEFWEEGKIFEQSVAKNEGGKEFVFYEGPPTANGKPGIHHLESRSFKDIIPRYKTMQGFHVRRKGGWDTHGLPVELEVEKTLGLKSKKEIEEYGIAAFNQKCRENVWKYVDAWQDFTKRIGYWVDEEHPYVTYHNDYIESLWNVLAKVDERKLLYKDYKVVPYCPRCGTALSSHELAQGYQDDKDLSITAKFKIVGQENTYLLAWTTTPWTLPGNVGLAVGEDIDYVAFKYYRQDFDAEKPTLIKISDDIFIASKDFFQKMEIGSEKIMEKEMKGRDLIGLSYEPLFPYLQELDAGDPKLANAYKVYPADFVTTTDGTGIVHTAVMYGQEDFELGTKVGLPKFHLVNPDGTFVKGTGEFEGRFVKEKDEAGKPTLDVDIIRYLTAKNLFFKKELYTHSYPHCWRCKTPLIYYARDSWYIGMSTLREELIQANEGINWEPSYIKQGRFGEWLKDIKDWAISRERYWGTPLPIWVAEDGERLVVDSYDMLKKYAKKSGNKYFVMRHGEAGNNTSKMWTDEYHHHAVLTEKGQGQVLESISKLGEKIDVVFSSPFERARQSTEIVCQKLGFPSDEVMYDARLQELEPGNEFEGQELSAVKQYYNHDYVYSPEKRLAGGESFADVLKRQGDFIYDIESKFQNKNILIVGHAASSRALEFVASGFTFRDLEKKNNEHSDLLNAEIRELSFAPLPHNENYEFDPHRPYIDEIVLEKDGPASADGSGVTKKEYRRVKEVMDVWFDSGAMPLAQDHYPFENKEWVDGAGYPADYICEAIDQTRGWFYTLHAVGTLLGRGKAYKNVICLGHILDDKGKKMSKSQGNIIEPWAMIDKYGVDTLRMWMYSVNQPGESKNFDEKTVKELQGKIFTLLDNVVAFYELYRDKSLELRVTSYELHENVLDAWIVARLDQLIALTTSSLDEYKVLEPARAIREFIDDLSTWYLRRSRDRLKSASAQGSGETRDGEEAKMTLYFVLKNLAKVMAPFAPFFAEDLWQKLKIEGDQESVHLAKWPEMKKAENEELITKMEIVIGFCQQGNALRQKAGIPVRQTLQSITIPSTPVLEEQFHGLIKDELNVKEVLSGTELQINTEITPELKQEGQYRELVRAVQDLRKKQGLTPKDVISITISDNALGLIELFMDDFKKTVLAKDVEFAENDGESIKIESLTIKILLKA